MSVIEVPGHGEVEFPDTMSDEEIVSAIQRDLSPQKQELGLGNAALRMGVKGATSLPLMAMDLGVASRNVLGNLGNAALGKQPTPDYELPSSQFNREVLDRYTTPPKELAGKIAEFGGSVAAGGAIPAPQLAQAPANFQRALTPAQQTLQAGQKAGLVVPPATVNPTLLNRALETVGGKVATAADASAKNQGVINQAASKTLGLADDTPLTPELLNTIRAQAGQAYEDLRGIGQVAADAKYAKDLAQIAATTKGAAKAFPGLASNEIDDIVKTLDQKAFDADSAVDAMAVLRDKAASAYARGDKSVGKAYRAASQALEDMLERTLKTAGNADLLTRFKDARTLIAKTYSVENALNPATGNIAGQKLAGQLGKGKPMTGDLKAAGRFAQAFPKAAREVLDSGSVRNTDLIVGGGTAALAREPWYLLYPFLRQAARGGVLSDAGQKYLTGLTDSALPPGLLGPAAVGAGLLGEQY